jgi:hypothetical protein
VSRRAISDRSEATRLHRTAAEGNDRVRDIIDIWLLEALLDPSDLATVRSAAIETFRRRQNHRWPPLVTSSDSWTRDYSTLTAEHPDAPPTIDAVTMPGSAGRQACYVRARRHRQGPQSRRFTNPTCPAAA